jgi:hypothetical protein
VKWFRAYHSILDSIRVRKLPVDAQLDFWWLLCCASEARDTRGENDGNTNLTLEEAIWRTRSTTLTITFTALRQCGLCALSEAQKIVVCDWSRLQFLSDDVSSRALKSMRKKRKRARVNNDVNTNVNVTDTEQIQINLKHSRKLRDESAFESFWKAYPKRKSKGQAEKAWHAINPDSECVTRIIQGLARAKTCREWQKENGKWIPHPATWLRARGWEDDDGDSSPAGHLSPRNVI